MTTQAARDLLTKELFIRRNVVTFRSLSRELGIHVNIAKNELKAYYESTQGTDTLAVPTYLVSGQLASSTGGRQGFDNTPDEYSMDLDFDDGRDPDVVYTSKVMLVDAEVLAETTSQFLCTHSVHIYSLSPSKLKDAGLICAASASVQKADATRGLESLHVLGKICGAHVQSGGGGMRVAALAASSSKEAPNVSKQSPKAARQAKPEQPKLKGGTSTSTLRESATTEETAALKVEAKEKPKPSGKLDWSRAKTKEKENGVNPPPKDLKAMAPPKPVPASKTDVLDDGNSHEFNANKRSHHSAPSVATVHRGVKRKSHVASDLQEESPSLCNPVAPSRSTEVKNTVSESDDDEESDVRIPGRRRYRGKNDVISDTETSLKAMMDIDDAQIIRAPRRGQAKPVSPSAVEASSDEDDDKESMLPPPISDTDDADDEPIVKPKRKKPAKVVPVGRNGLKKKRVMKTRTMTDAKGYIQTEDYSSYESVEEDAQSEPVPKAKSKAVKKVAEKPMDKETPKNKQRSAPKTKKGGVAKRGSLLNFFGPDK